MNFWLKVLLGIVIFFVLLGVIGALVRMAFGLIVFLAFVGIIVAVVSSLYHNWKEQQANKPPGKREQNRVEKKIERDLKDLEKKVNRM